MTHGFLQSTGIPARFGGICVFAQYSVAWTCSVGPRLSIAYGFSTLTT